MGEGGGRKEEGIVCTLISDVCHGQGNRNKGLCSSPQWWSKAQALEMPPELLCGHRKVR